MRFDHRIGEAPIPTSHLSQTDRLPDRERAASSPSSTRFRFQENRHVGAFSPASQFPVEVSMARPAFWAAAKPGPSQTNSTAGDCVSDSFDRSPQPFLSINSDNLICRQLSENASKWYSLFRVEPTTNPRKQVRKRKVPNGTLLNSSCDVRIRYDHFFGATFNRLSVPEARGIR